MTSVINLIRHYQRDIERCSENEARVLRCLSKLHQLGVTVQHLQDTGVGRTVNALRKEPGEVGTAARALVAKWKDMVANAEESSEEEDDDPHSGRDSGGDSARNMHQSRISSQSYESDHERGESCKSYKETNGEAEISSKRYNDGYDDTSSKRAKYNDVKVKEETSDDEMEPYNDEDEDNQTQLKKESNIDSDSEQEIAIKQEPKSEENRESKLSKHSSKEHSDKSKHKKDHSKSETHHRSEKKFTQHRDKTDDEKNKKKEKESKHHSQKRDKKHSSSSDKQKTSEKSERKSSKSSSEKEKSSKDKHNNSSDKQRHSKHKDKTKETDNREHREKIESVGSSHRDNPSSTSRHKEKHSKPESAKAIEKSANKENSSASTSESSSKSKHSDKSLSHSHKSSLETSTSGYKSKGVKRSDKQASNADKHKSSSSHKSSSGKSGEVPKKKSKSQKDSVDSDEGIDCESGKSFADALGMASPVKVKKKFPPQETSSPTNGSTHAPKLNGAFSLPSSLLPTAPRLPPLRLEPLEISALPEISPNYKPRPPPKLLPAVSEEEALNYVMSTKNQRTKVFSGNKTYGKVLSLYDLCVNVLQEHIDALEYTGGVPYEILKPVVDKSTPEQLFQLEHFNPYLMEDTNHLWQKHCERRFRTKKRLEMDSETWREMYLRCQEEQEARLKSLTANIKMAQDARNEPTKKTKMAYVDSMVKPPRNIARKQAIHGTARLAVTSPAARVAALAGVGVAVAGSNPVRAVGRPVASSSFKPKKAPLMQKALQFMRGRKR